MLASRLMTRGVFVLGALMIVLGLIFITSGVPVVRLEIGWTEIIGGAVAASAGCVVLVMGVLLVKLDRLQATVAAGIGAAPVVATSPTAAPVSHAFGEPLPPEPVEDAGESPPVLAQAGFAPRPTAVSPAHVDVIRPEPSLDVLSHPEEVAAPPPLRVHSRADEPVLNAGAPALVAAEEEDASHTPPLPAPDRVADAVVDAPPARARSTFLNSLLARRPFGAAAERPPTSPEPAAPSFDAPLALDAPAAPPGRSPIDLSSGWDDERPDLAPRLDAPSPNDDVYAHMHGHARAEEPLAEATVAAEDEALAPEVPSPVPPAEPAEPPRLAIAPVEPSPAPADPLAPVVVGRYNAGAASYVMYSNGMIEVETEGGTHQFASMQELKAFIEKRDTRVS